MTPPASRSTSDRRSPRLPWIALGLTLLLLWLVGYPLLLTALAGVGLAGGRGSDGFTLEAVRAFVTRADEWRALWGSVWISLASVGLAGAIGVPLAFLFGRTDFPGRRTLGALVALPVTLPPLVGVIAFLYLVGESGFLSRALQGALGLERPPWRLVGPGAILLVHAYSMYVYFYLFVRAALARLDASQLEAASSLGASRGRIFWRVTLPQLRPALLGASLLTFMTSLGSFSAPYIFGGGYRVMTTQIIASRINGELALAMVEAVVLALCAVAALIGIRLAQGRDPGLGGHGLAPRPRPLRSPWLRLGAAALGWAIAAIVVLPHLTLVLISFVPPATWTTELLPPALGLDNYRAVFAEPERLRPVLNSLWMATVATLGAVVLGVGAARQSLVQSR
ncbi:MAG: ABC transporter permease subunit, partial [Acidobacteriota bacterium]